MSHLDDEDEKLSQSLADCLFEMKDAGYLRVFDDTLDLSIDDAIKMAQEDPEPGKRYSRSDCWIFAEPRRATENVPVFAGTLSGLLSECVRQTSRAGAGSIVTNAGTVDICDYLASVIEEERDTEGFANRRFRVDLDKQTIYDVEDGKTYVGFAGPRLALKEGGKKGGSARGGKKSLASVANGRKGGRPRTGQYYVIIGTSAAAASSPRYTLNYLSEDEIIRIAEDDLIKRGSSLYQVAGIEEAETPDGDYDPVREWKQGEKLEAALESLRRDSGMFDIYPDTTRGVREFRKAAKVISLDLYMRALKFSQ